MFKKFVRKYRRIIVTVAGVLLIGGVVTGVVISNKGDDTPKKDGVSINAGNDNKDNQADFNGQDSQQTTTQPVVESPTDDNFDTVIEQKGSIIGEWTTSNGDTFYCTRSSDGTLHATMSIYESSSSWSGTAETDHTSYIKITDGSSGSVKDIEIVQMATASEVGLDGNQIYLLLKLSGETSERLFRRANEDYMHEDVQEIIDSAGDGVSGGSPDDEQYIPNDMENQIIDIENPEEETEVTVPEE